MGAEMRVKVGEETWVDVEMRVEVPTGSDADFATFTKMTDTCVAMMASVESKLRCLMLAFDTTSCCSTTFDTRTNFERSQPSYAWDSESTTNYSMCAYCAILLSCH